MNAVVFERPGAASERLELQEVDTAVPRGDEVLVRVEARPIHPADFMFIEGRYRIEPSFPQIAGLEGSCTVVAAGQSARCVPVHCHRTATKSPSAGSSSRE
jgi:NADPH2:quinone reductase